MLSRLFRKKVTGLKNPQSSVMLFSFLLQDNDYSKLKIATTVRKPLILTKNAVICGLLADNFLNCTRQAYKEKLPNM